MTSIESFAPLVPTSALSSFSRSSIYWYESWSLPRLSNAGISIEALIQKAPQAGETRVPVIILTNETQEHRLNDAVRALAALESIESDITRIRVESLDG